MGSARIERMQVHSFWLEVPRRALERLPGDLAPELAVRLASVKAPGGELLELGAEQGPSLLRFAPVEDGVVGLQEIQIRDDADGAFFLATLGALMVRYGGDLEAQVHGPRGAPPAPLRIVRGVTDYPGLSTHAAANHLSQAAHDAGAMGGAGAPAQPPQQGAAGAAGEPGPGGAAAPQASAAEEKELHELLSRAEAHWAEYQRLKGRRQG